MKQLTIIVLLLTFSIQAQNKKIEKLIDDVEPKVIVWRRDFHQNPELSNREFETSKKIAAHLQSLGMEVQTGIAHTGVVGILKGNNPGPVVALRADMDALPVTERTPVPFASKVIGEYNGIEILEEIRKDPSIKEIKVFTTSGFDYSKECLEKGSEGFLQKPYLPSDLLEMIKQFS